MRPRNPGLNKREGEKDELINGPKGERSLKTRLTENRGLSL